jgi:hypothetical protein
MNPLDKPGAFIDDLLVMLRELGQLPLPQLGLGV